MCLSIGKLKGLSANIVLDLLLEREPFVETAIALAVSLLVLGIGLLFQ
jgi:hypothetical protein